MRQCNVDMCVLHTSISNISVVDPEKGAPIQDIVGAVLQRERKILRRGGNRHNKTTCVFIMCEIYPTVINMVVR